MSRWTDVYCTKTRKELICKFLVQQFSSGSDPGPEKTLYKDVYQWKSGSN